MFMLIKMMFKNLKLVLLLQAANLVSGSMLRSSTQERRQLVTDPSVLIDVTKLVKKQFGGNCDKFYRYFDTTKDGYLSEAEVAHLASRLSVFLLVDNAGNPDYEPLTAAQLYEQCRERGCDKTCFCPTPVNPSTPTAPIPVPVAVPVPVPVPVTVPEPVPIPVEVPVEAPVAIPVEVPVVVPVEVPVAIPVEVPVVVPVEVPVVVPVEVPVEVPVVVPVEVPVEVPVVVPVVVPVEVPVEVPVSTPVDIPVLAPQSPPTSGEGPVGGGVVGGKHANFLTGHMNLLSCLHSSMTKTRISSPGTRITSVIMEHVIWYSYITHTLEVNLDWTSIFELNI